MFALNIISTRIDYKIWFLISHKSKIKQAKNVSKTFLNLKYNNNNKKTDSKNDRYCILHNDENYDYGSFIYISNKHSYHFVI